MDVVSDLSLDDIVVGEKKEFTVTITESMVDDFAKLSGDFNPIHMDDKYANLSGFQSRVCHGVLLASFFSRLVGMYLPGKRALYFSQSLNFINPCYANESILVRGQVISKSTSTRIITLKTSIINSVGKCIVEGQAKVIVRK